MIKNLSRFFRYGLSDGKEIITIEEEIKHVEAFLEIEKFRYKNRFKVYFNLDKRLLQHKTLKFILQPFVENAFVHGFKETNGEGIIRIQLFSNEDNIYFEVIDDGVGMEPDLINKVLKEKSEGYGIKNVDERIKLKYGIQYGITIYSRLGEGTNVTIAIPKNPPSEEENSLIL
jgi:two-component system sensor histidine kinase YesM